MPLGFRSQRIRFQMNTSQNKAITDITLCPQSCPLMTTLRICGKRISGGVKSVLPPAESL